MAAKGEVPSPVLWSITKERTHDHATRHPSQPARRLFDFAQAAMNYEGLVQGKKATIILTSGSDFSPGTPYASFNQAEPYLRQILGFIGITDVNVILAGRSLAVDTGEKTLNEFAEQFSGQLQSAVA
jgi:FMN-dependent NADH-azoreductase